MLGFFQVRVGSEFACVGWVRVGILDCWVFIVITFLFHTYTTLENYSKMNA